MWYFMGNLVMWQLRIFLSELSGGPEKGRLRLMLLFMRVHRGYGVPTGCPWA